MKALGGGLFLIGLAAVITATGLFADPLVGVPVPRFVPGLVGVAFCAAAGMAWYRDERVLNNAFAAVLCRRAMNRPR